MSRFGRIMLYLIIALEGFVVLASELLAMRLLIPFVGNGTETIAIIIAAVLMPLAVGYYVGGQHKLNHGSVRLRLQRNVVNASFVLAIGLSYAFLETYFQILRALGLQHHVWQAAIYSLCFLVYPVYLLGQTVPLVGHYFSRGAFAESAGKILFFSTIGSFLGAIMTTMLLMPLIGVHQTVLVVIVMQAVIVWLLSKTPFSAQPLLALMVVVIAFSLNREELIMRLDIVEANQYSTIKVFDREENGGEKIFSVNNSASSLLSHHTHRPAAYIQFMEERFLPSVPAAKPRRILVIGAGAFTIGLDDSYHRYDFVDVDPSLKRLAEQHFLPSLLTENKRFIVQPARAFLNETDARYDVIIIDAFTNVNSIPFQLVTHQFFRQVKERLAEGGVVAMNAVVSPSFETNYAVHLDNSFRSVFPHASREVLKPHNVWKPKQYENVIYSYVDRPHVGSRMLYSDDVNRLYLDK